MIHRIICVYPFHRNLQFTCKFTNCIGIKYTQVSYQSSNAKLLTKIVVDKNLHGVLSHGFGVEVSLDRIGKVQFNSKNAQNTMLKETIEEERIIAHLRNKKNI